MDSNSPVPTNSTENERPLPPPPETLAPGNSIPDAAVPTGTDIGPSPESSNPQKEGTGSAPVTPTAAPVPSPPNPPGVVSIPAPPVPTVVAPTSAAPTAPPTLPESAPTENTPAAESPAPPGEEAIAKAPAPPIESTGPSVPSTGGPPVPLTSGPPVPPPTNPPVPPPTDPPVPPVTDPPVPPPTDPPVPPATAPPAPSAPSPPAPPAAAPGQLPYPPYPVPPARGGWHPPPFAPPVPGGPPVPLPPRLPIPGPPTAHPVPPGVGRPPPPQPPLHAGVRPPPGYPRLPPPPAHLGYPIPPAPGAHHPPIPPSPEAPPEWTAHDGGNGRYYYFNHYTQESRWERPDGHPYLPGPLIGAPPPPVPPPLPPRPRPPAILPGAAGAAPPHLRARPPPPIPQTPPVPPASAAPRPAPPSELAAAKATAPPTISSGSKAAPAAGAKASIPPGVPVPAGARPPPPIPPQALFNKARTTRGGLPAFKLQPPGAPGTSPPPLQSGILAAQKKRSEGSDPDHLKKIRDFRAMLKEKGVTPFSTWEKMLPKLVFDPRFTAVERKEERRAVFNNFVKTRAQEERRERRDAVKSAQTALQEFLDLPMSQELLEPDSTLETFTQKLTKKHRKAVKELLKLLPPKDKNAIFEEKLKPIREAHRLETETKKEIQRDAFLELLSETKDISKRSHWGSRVRRLLEGDKRYRECAPELREELFESYVHNLRKDKDEVKRAAKRKREEAERQRRMQEETQRKEEERKRREREAEERDRFQKQLGEATKQFKEILREKVEDPRIVWRDFEWDIQKHEAARDALAVLGDKASGIFRVHIEGLKSGLEEEFNTCLKRVLDNEDSDSDADENDSTSNDGKRDAEPLELGLLWVEAKERLKTDPAFKRCRGKVECEKLFKRHMRGHVEAAKATLHEYLKTNGSKKGITRFTSTTGEGFEKALDALEDEPCFERLNSFKSDREAVVIDYIEDLQDEHLKSKRRKY